MREGWEPAQRLVRSIQDRINAYDVRLQGRELNLFSIGRILARLSEVMIGAEEIPNDFRERLHDSSPSWTSTQGLPGGWRMSIATTKGTQVCATCGLRTGFCHVVRSSVINLQVEAD